MLQFFRSAFSSKIGLAITLGFVALIAVAFALSDVTGSGNFGGVAGGDRVATIGDDRIDTSQLSKAATGALESLKEENPTLSMKAFLAQGGLDRVLEQMIDRAAVAEFGRRHGLVASERLIDSEIAKVPAFMGPDGKFSDTAFRQLLQQRGLSEAMVREDLMQGLVAKQVLLPAQFGNTVPRELTLRYAALLRESRSGAIGVLPAAAFVPKTAPSDANLAAWYAKNRDKFIRPERRVIRYASFGDSALKPLPAPTEAELTALYNANKALYSAQESRAFTQLIVPTEAAAKAILAEVAKGVTLEAAASAKGLSTAKLEKLTRQALASQASQAVADASFAAAPGALAAPARSGLGWHIMRVDSVEKRMARSLDQVRGELTTLWVTGKRRAALSDLSARLEEEFDDGGSLADAAKELGLTLEQTPTITADGQVYGKPGPGAPPILARVLQTAFSMEKENEPQLAEVEPGKTFLIYDVSNIEQSAPAPISEIKQDVAAAYMLDKGSLAAKAASARVIAEVNKGKTLAAAMASLGVPLPPAQPINMSREELTRAGPRVPPPLMLLFSMAKGTVKTLPAPGDQGWFVVSLASITPGKVAADDPVLAAAQRELGSVAGQEYAEQMRRAIRAEVGVEKNETAIKAVRTQLGGGN